MTQISEQFYMYILLGKDSPQTLAMFVQEIAVLLTNFDLPILL